LQHRTQDGVAASGSVWPPTGAPIVLAAYFAEVHGTDAQRDAAIADVARSVVCHFRR
jgi:hypothetical protein